LVDDQASVRKALAESLTEAKFQVFEAGTLAEARDRMAERSPIAAVVVDIALKDGGGEPFARELRAAYPASRVVVVTGYSESAIRERLSNDPSVAVLGKPTDAGAVLQALQDLGVAQRP